MFKTSTTVTALTSIAAAAAIAFLLVLPDAVQARTQHVVKRDRLDVRRLGATCSQRAWPSYEDACLRDRNQPRSEARQVRIVSADHLTGAR